jgi:hypothetical protein
MILPSYMIATRPQTRRTAVRSCEMRDEQIAEEKPLAQVHQEVQDLCPDVDVEHRRRAVGTTRSGRVANPRGQADPLLRAG